MRRPLLAALLLTFAPGPASAQAQAQSQAPDADLTFLKDLGETRGWRLGTPTSVKITPDGATVIFLRSPPRSPVRGLFAMDVATGQVRELVTTDQILKGAAETLSPAERALRERKRVTARGFTEYDLSRDGKQLLVQLSGRAYVVPVAGGAAREVAGPDAKGNPMFRPRLSPDGASVAFVRGDELWVAPARGGGGGGGGGKARQLSRGATATIGHGQAEFVAAEELSRHDGFWWSPDSKKLIYQRTDTTGVERHAGVDAARPFDAGHPSAYPRAGRPNVKVAMGLVAATGGKTTWIDWDTRSFEYVERVSWQEGAPPTMILRSRDQKQVSLVAIDPRSGATRELLHERDDAWVELGLEDTWLRDGSGFLWSTDRRGDWQLELRGPDGALRGEVMPATWGYRSLVHVDDTGRSLVVSRGASLIDSQLWRVPLDGGEPRALTKGPDVHTATFARSGGTHVLRVSPFQGAGRSVVVRADGSTAGELPSVAEKPPFQANLEVKQLGGFWTAIVRPRAFDRKKKYPVIVEVYGGPGVSVVYPVAQAFIDWQWMADHGFIVVASQNRGTPGHGREWERAMLGAFATVPLEDQVKALQAMAAHEPAMDLTRVGIMGSSFGGFMAALAVMRRPDVFKAAVASAPVADWTNYDTAYTERYLGVPPPAGDSELYERNGLLPYAKDLRRPLLIVHGTADDNVHFSESLLLMDAIFRGGAGEHAELLPMVALTHMFDDARLKAIYWQRVFGFFRKHLR